jgi:phospholipid transport system substrate-binding protein
MKLSSINLQIPLCLLQTYGIFMRFIFSRTTLLISALFLVFWLAIAPPSKAEASEATAVIDTFHAALLNTMKSAKKLGVKGRYDILKPAVLAAFDLRTTVRVATGSAWRKASSAEKGELVRTFEHWTISNYVSQFKGYSGEGFKTHSERAGPQKTRLVKTDIKRVKGNPVGLTYVLKQKNTKWRIVDVLLENSISQLAVRRSEYREILAGGGIKKLVETLKANAKQLLTH